MFHTSIAQVSGTPLATLLGQLTAIEEVCRAGEIYPQRKIASWHFQYTVSGRADALADGTALHHGPGSLLILAPGVQLSETVQERWHLRYLILTGAWPDLLRQLLGDRRALLLPDPPRPCTAAVEGCAHQLQHRRPGWGFRAAAELAVLLGGLQALLTEAREGDLLSRMGLLVDAEPAKAWDVGSIARTLHLPTRTLQARFRALAPEGVARWILHRRLDHARLLLDRGLQVNVVAKRMGFANPFHFSRAFRRVLGAPPSGLRRP